MDFIREPIHPDLPSLPYATPFPKKRPFTKQVWHDGHPVKPGDIVSRLALFEIGLHGSEMVLARDFQGFGLFGADAFLGALDTGMTEQQLGRAQIAGLLVDMSREGPAQRMQPVETGIEAGLFQPGFEQPPELAFAEMGVGPPCPLPREQPCMHLLFRGGKIGTQAVARPRRQARLHRARIAAFSFLLADLDGVDGVDTPT